MLKTPHAIGFYNTPCKMQLNVDVPHVRTLQTTKRENSFEVLFQPLQAPSVPRDTIGNGMIGGKSYDGIMEVAAAKRQPQDSDKGGSRGKKLPINMPIYAENRRMTLAITVIC
jgi:hypothetical protein